MSYVSSGVAINVPLLNTLTVLTTLVAIFALSIGYRAWFGPNLKKRHVFWTMVAFSIAPISSMYAADTEAIHMCFTLADCRSEDEIGMTINAFAASLLLTGTVIQILTVASHRTHPVTFKAKPIISNGEKDYWVAIGWSLIFFSAVAGLVSLWLKN